MLESVRCGQESSDERGGMRRRVGGVGDVIAGGDLPLSIRLYFSRPPALQEGLGGADTGSGEGGEGLLCVTAVRAFWIKTTTTKTRDLVLKRIDRAFL